jgi:crossover junction endodeoxyribonuclease RuvC
VARGLVIVGVDPGFAIVGYGAVEHDGGRFRVVGYGSIETKAGAPMEERLLAIHRGFAGVLGGCGAGAVAVEKLFFGRNRTTGIAVAQARGVLLLAAAERGLPVAEYSPQEVKLAVTGYGRGDKAQVQRMVRLLLNLGSAPRPDDVADALAVAVCHAHASKLAEAARGALAAQAAQAGPAVPAARAALAGQAGVAGRAGRAGQAARAGRRA